MADYAALLPHIKLIAKQAGDIVMQVYLAGLSSQQIHYKADHSPVTQAKLQTHPTPVSYTHLTLPTIRLV